MFISYLNGISFSCLSLCSFVYIMSDELATISDLDDTIVLSPERNTEDQDPEVAALVNKYISQNALHKEVVTVNHYDLSDNDDEPGVSLIKRTKKNDSIELPGCSSSHSHSVIESDALRILHEKYKQVEVHESTKRDDMCSKGKINKKDLKKLEKELQKQKKIEEREQRRKELEREKCIKQAAAAANKNLKPSECMKFVTVGIDNEIISQEYGNEIINALQAVDVEYKIESQIFPQTIVWTRKAQSHSFDDDDGKLVLNSKEEDADDILLIMNCKNFVEHVNNNTLCGTIQSIQSVLMKKKITLIVYGLQSYARFLKNQQQSEMRTQITGEKKKGKTAFEDFPKITKKMIEHKLTELQLLCSCSHRLIDSAADLGLLVTQFTKAVAEVPFKLQQYEKFQQTDWFATGDNRDSVKVDKNGNGLNRLWNQMLTTFPLARLETAEAISLNFPTVSSLMMAYENCESVKDAETLLQDIPIRRAAGPLSSSRRIGPELSKKIYNFFTSIDGDVLL